jgi:hypothetical protein
MFRRLLRSPQGELFNLRSNLLLQFCGYISLQLLYSYSKKHSHKIVPVGLSVHKNDLSEGGATVAETCSMKGDN